MTFPSFLNISIGHTPTVRCMTHIVKFRTTLTFRYWSILPDYGYELNEVDFKGIFVLQWCI